MLTKLGTTKFYLTTVWHKHKRIPPTKYMENRVHYLFSISKRPSKECMKSRCML